MIILASASPRRKELLKLITEDFIVVSADLDERLADSGDPRETVEALALQKAGAVFASYPRDTVIGSDTAVALEGRVFGKPRDKSEAAAMLRALSGKTHTVFTGVGIVAPGVRRVFSQETRVSFLDLSDREIKAYIETGEPFDKAGAYGIQGKGALLISKIAGDFYTVMGLPVARLHRELLALELL